MPQLLRTLIIVLALLLFGLGAVRSQERWAQFTTPERVEEAAKLREKVLQAADLQEVHHEVFNAVGAQAWDAAYRDAITSDLIKMVISGTGKPFPSDEEALAWLREHRAEVHDRVRAYVAAAPAP